MQSRILDVNEKLKEVPFCFYKLKNKTTFRLGEFMSLLIRAIKENGFDGLGHLTKANGGVPVCGSGEREKWFNQGVSCEIYNPKDGNWEKGRLRIKVLLEFEPDEKPEVQSELDMIRQMEYPSP